MRILSWYENNFSKYKTEIYGFLGNSGGLPIANNFAILKVAGL